MKFFSSDSYFISHKNNFIIMYDIISKKFSYTIRCLYVRCLTCVIGYGVAEYSMILY